MAIDPLAEIVTLLQPAVRFSKLVECAEPWRVHRSGTGEPFYCAVLEGECRVIVDGQPAQILRSGDFVLAPAMHDLVVEDLHSARQPGAATPVEIAPGRFRAGPADGPVLFRMRVGHCRFGSADAALLVQLLPRVILMRDVSRLALLMQLVDEETRAGRPARELVLERLLEVLLIEALRSESVAATAPGIVRGLSDERLSSALRALHADPGHAWTIAALARIASLSRSAFFARFTRTLGVPPMEYLLTWRMALAQQMLRASDTGIAGIAERVGYSSASTFTAAFTRHIGVSPARYSRAEKINVDRAT